MKEIVFRLMKFIGKFLPPYIAALIFCFGILYTAIKYIDDKSQKLFVEVPPFSIQYIIEKETNLCFAYHLRDTMPHKGHLSFVTNVPCTDEVLSKAKEFKDLDKKKIY